MHWWLRIEAKVSHFVIVLKFFSIYRVLNRSRKKTGTSADIIDSGGEESGGAEGRISKQEKQRRRLDRQIPTLSSVGDHFCLFVDGKQGKSGERGRKTVKGAPGGHPLPNLPPPFSLSLSPLLFHWFLPPSILNLLVPQCFLFLVVIRERERLE